MTDLSTQNTAPMWKRILAGVAGFVLLSFGAQFLLVRASGIGVAIGLILMAWAVLEFAYALGFWRSKAD